MRFGSLRSKLTKRHGGVVKWYNDGLTSRSRATGVSKTNMFYVYILKLNTINKKFYVGYTSNLEKRFIEHKNGRVKTTKDKNPKLIYYEAYDNKYLALLREKGIKRSGSVYNALFKRIKLK